MDLMLSRTCMAGLQVTRIRRAFPKLIVNAETAVPVSAVDISFAWRGS